VAPDVIGSVARADPIRVTPGVEREAEDGDVGLGADRTARDVKQGSEWPRLDVLAQAGEAYWRSSVA
jgi:hypothetical protein